MIISLVPCEYRRGKASNNTFCSHSRVQAMRSYCGVSHLPMCCMPKASIWISSHLVLFIVPGLGSRWVQPVIPACQTCPTCPSWAGAPLPRPPRPPLPPSKTLPFGGGGWWVVGLLVCVGSLTVFQQIWQTGNESPLGRQRRTASKLAECGNKTPLGY